MAAQNCALKPEKPRSIRRNVPFHEVFRASNRAVRRATRSLTGAKRRIGRRALILLAPNSERPEINPRDYRLGNSLT